MSVAWRRSRFINALCCYGNYALSRFGLVHISHAPLFISVEPASVCQLHCPECPVGNGAKATGKKVAPYMSRDVWQRVLAEVAPYAWVMQFYFQGEPLLHPDLPQMISDAHKEGLYTIVSTNAQAMTEELAEALVRAGLDRIIVSMDGLTEESYSAYRVGGQLAQCKKALRWLREAKERLKGRMVIELQCLRLRTNEQEWKAFEQQYKALGADRLVFKTAQLYHYESGHPLMPTDNRYSRYARGKDGRYHRKPLRKGCWRAWSGAVVTTTGEVLPCCYDKERAFAYGNILSTPLRELYSNQQSIAFRRAAIQEQPTICQECNQ